ncbi:hypothetical protein OPT61_g9127 [Boeremia exigua]|uniref:Uncharacterized protein n=1 Tax=Boeremia exigua TaxID=749465 RepID=A0ACC2HVE5_9PLEO|nr:hypothetical protein OPT61_g9127 [Boeremia exigua]
MARSKKKTAKVQAAAKEQHHRSSKLQQAVPDTCKELSLKPLIAENSRAACRARRLRLRDALLGPRPKFSGTVTIPDIQHASQSDAIRLEDIQEGLVNGQAAVYWAGGAASRQYLGAGIVWYEEGLLHSEHFKLGPRIVGSNMDADVYAIAAAIHHAKISAELSSIQELLRVYTNSLGVLTSVRSGKCTWLGPMVDDKFALEVLYRNVEWLASHGVTVELVWVKGHSGNVWQKLGQDWVDEWLYRVRRASKVSMSDGTPGDTGSTQSSGLDKSNDPGLLAFEVRDERENSEKTDDRSRAGSADHLNADIQSAYTCLPSGKAQCDLPKTNAQKRDRKKRTREDFEADANLTNLDIRGTNPEGDVVAGARMKAMKLHLDNEAYARYSTRHEASKVCANSMQPEKNVYRAARDTKTLAGTIGVPFEHDSSRRLRAQARCVHSVARAEDSSDNLGEHWVGDVLLCILEGHPSIIFEPCSLCELDVLSECQTQSTAMEFDLMASPGEIGKTDHEQGDSQSTTKWQRFWWGDLEEEEAAAVRPTSFTSRTRTLHCYPSIMRLQLTLVVAAVVTCIGGRELNNGKEPLITDLHHDHFWSPRLASHKGTLSYTGPRYRVRRDRGAQGFEGDEFASDADWQKFTNKGGTLMCGLDGNDEEAGLLMDDKRVPPSAASLWTGDLRQELTTWGWTEIDSSGYACDLDEYWHMTSMMEALDLNAKPQSNGGDNVCYRVEHWNPKQVKDGQRVPAINQWYNVDGTDYQVRHLPTFLAPPPLTPHPGNRSAF